MNFRNFGEATMDGAGLKPVETVPLSRQLSIYSLTFDEFQNTLGGIGKDFGSMNMDELLKNIWSAEESQNLAMAGTSVGGGGDGNLTGGNLQRQGSLKLPRTLSQKTVDEVFRDLMKEIAVPNGSSGGGGGVGGSGETNMPQRQPTLGEITLEEFLVRAGVVREDMQQVGRQNNGGFFGDMLRQSNNNGLGFDFQQPNRSNGLLGNGTAGPNQVTSMGLNVGGIGSQQQIQQLPQHLQPPLLPKPGNLAFAPPVSLPNSTDPASIGGRGARIGMMDAAIKTNLVQAGGLQNGGMGLAGLANGGVTVASTGSPASQVSPDILSKCGVETPTLSSPVPHPFGRGRKSAALEKVVERRQRRMIKNRESAARSRARKQAYTLELEAEIAKLKEVNEELQRKQAEMMEMQKDQMLEKMNRPWGNKRQCLRRTLTGPW